MAQGRADRVISLTKPGKANTQTNRRIHWRPECRRAVPVHRLFRSIIIEVPLRIQLSGIVIIVGNYGSGKTEISINLALASKKAGMAVRMADLDLVNPYFRTREARRQMAIHEIDLVLPAAPYLHADLPVLSPAVAGLIRNPGPLTILDVGGDDAGATVLSALADAFRNQTVDMLQVINPLRPQTATLEGCLRMREKIEAASRLAITGLIGNAHLLDATTVDIVRDGYRFVQRLADASRLPLKFVTAPSRVAQDATLEEVACPILPIRRQLVPPWLSAASLEEV